MKTFKKILSSLLVCALIFGVGAFGAYAATVPADPANLRANKALYKEGEYISIFWDAVSGATDYWVNIYDRDNGEKVYSIKNGTETSISIVTGLPPAGNYRLVVLAGNSEGYSAGNNAFYFTVYNTVPDPISVLSTEKELYSESESIVVAWDFVPTADKYTVMLPDGSEVKLSNVNKYTIAPHPAGTYEVKVKPGNSYGYSDYSVCTFSVYNSAPEAPENLKVSKNTYSDCETPCFSWDFVYNATEYGYSVSKDGEIITSGKTENTNISLDALASGNYVFSVKSVNSIGESGSVSVNFTVYHEEYTLSYDLNGGTGSFASQSGGKTYTIYAHMPQKSGYNFGGWINPDSPADVVYNAGDSITITKNTTLVAVWSEIPPEPVKIPTISFTNTLPSSFNYGDMMIMKVAVTDAPEGAKIVWETAGNGVSISASPDGTSCTVTSTGSGTATVTAKLVDANGSAIKNANGADISVSKEIKSNAGFFQKIISFFKNLFGLNRIVAQALSIIVK